MFGSLGDSRCTHGLKISAAHNARDKPLTGQRTASGGAQSADLEAARTPQDAPLTQHPRAQSGALLQRERLAMYREMIAL
jgi:hypothetical protein